MASKEYQIVVSAIGKGIKATTKSLSDGFTRGQRALAAFNATASKGKQAADRLTGSIKTLIGAYAGWQGVTAATRVIQEAEKAAFNLSTSVRAANREFDNIGSVAEWEATIARLSDRLKVYSDTDLKNAVSRTVDMTKRLGLEKDQMEELIARAADLGAGKVDLAGAIERVSSAMRGEAESAEYLGLTLNENYVKAWYAANNATKAAWKDLTEAQKAQVRLQVLLEQTNKIQGRAAESAKTFSGAIALMKKEITNSVSANKDVIATMNDLAESLRDNSAKIGDVVSVLVSTAAKAIEFAIKWKEVILVIVGTSVAYSALAKLAVMLKGLNAAFAVLTGSGVISWFIKLRSAILTATATAGAAQAAFFSLLGVIALYSSIMVVKAVKAFLEMRDAQRQAAEAAERAQKTIDDAKASYEAFKDVKIPGDITALAQADLEKFREKLYAARAYYNVLKIELEEKAKQRNFFGFLTDDAISAGEQLKEVNKRLDEVRDDISKIENQKGFERPKKEIMATSEQLEAFRKTAKEAYKSAEDDAKKYADKISDLNKQIADRDLSLADKIRDLRRSQMTEQQAAADLRLQAVEKEKAAQDALNKFVETGSERQLELAQKFASDAESAWTSYAGQGRAATEDAINGLQRVNNLLDKADKTQIDSFSKLRADAEKAMSEIDNAIKDLNAKAKINVPVELKNLEKVKKTINDLVRDETKKITIEFQEKRAAGGRVGMASGGRFPGNSKVDSIPVLARPGEGFVRNEALAVWDRKLGRGFFEAINAPWSKAGQSIIQALSGSLRMSMPKIQPPNSPALAFSSGGRVPGLSENLKDLGVVRLNVGDRSFPAIVKTDVAAELKDILRKGQARRSND